MYSLSGRSLQNLAGVHPDLVRVTKRVIMKTPIDFGVDEGVRTPERQAQLMRDKRTTTLHSQHFIQPETGYGHAIDIFAWVNNKAQYGKGAAKYYGPIVQTFITEATALGVQLRYGLLWKDFIDAFHIELHPKYARTPDEFY